MKALLCKDCNLCKIAFPLCAKLAQNSPSCFRQEILGGQDVISFLQAFSLFVAPISFIMPLAHALCSFCKLRSFFQVVATHELLQMALWPFQQYDPILSKKNSYSHKPNFVFTIAMHVSSLFLTSTCILFFSCKFFLLNFFYFLQVFFQQL